MSEVHTVTTSNYDDALIKVFTQGFTRNVDENDEVTHEEYQKVDVVIKNTFSIVANNQEHAISKVLEIGINKMLLDAEFNITSVTKEKK